MTSGEFARASRLSPKALRLYDELGLLSPAEVDPVTGYRRYAPAQLEQARLVAWLRRLGMPLARIQSVTGMPRAAVAADLAEYWRQVEAEMSARRDLAAFLIGYLSGRGTSMSANNEQLVIRYSVRSDVGLQRDVNEDSAYASTRLLAVADGMGGHAAGEVASTAVIDALRPLDTEIPAGELLDALDHAVRTAGSKLRHMAASDPSLAGMGTTLTALVVSGSHLGLVHIGDSRAYLLRDGELYQITHDHTMVQSLLDDGKITPAEVASHPQRSLILRALVANRDYDADLQLREIQARDRYLVCSDGLHEVADADAIAAVLRLAADPDRAAKDLIALAIAGGGPDNVTCVVADVEPAPVSATAIDRD
ncbi:MAG TPA: MerR family transcriptional regulator [Streptosporangiaceae bacterium]|nr:MerR family transcriptional regulator [Streptosporangiaceae bacterium]